MIRRTLLPIVLQWLISRQMQYTVVDLYGQTDGVQHLMQPLIAIDTTTKVL